MMTKCEIPAGVLTTEQRIECAIDAVEDALTVTVGKVKDAEVSMIIAQPDKIGALFERGAAMLKTVVEITARVAPPPQRERAEPDPLAPALVAWAAHKRIDAS